MVIPPEVSPPKPGSGNGLWLAILSVLIAGFAVHALLAARSKSATYDEPIHTLSNWLQINDGDFRLTPDHPALWRFVVGLGLIGQPLQVDLDSPIARKVLSHPELECNWSAEVLYRSPPAGADPLYGERLIARARTANALFAVLLACVVARWAWVWGGRLAAVVATSLLTFDPNFLAHGALVTNDVAATCMIGVATYSTWRLGQRLTWPRALVFATVCTAAVGIKFSCVLLAPMLGLTLLYRATDAAPWSLGRGNVKLRTRPRRLAAVFSICIGSLLLALIAQWPIYNFREAPTADNDYYRVQSVKDVYAYKQVYRAHLNDAVTRTLTYDSITAESRNYQPNTFVRALYALESGQWLPQSWAFGLVCIFIGSVGRESFFLGQVQLFGSALYFPVAILVKTPLVTLLFAVMSSAAGLIWLRRGSWHVGRRWKVACLLIPPALYLGAAMLAGLNIGIRHVLPVYIPVYVACGVIAAKCKDAGHTGWRIGFRSLVALALISLLIESGSVFPNYLNFFNRASGGASGGLSVLGDSNLDWGQDLPALADWYKVWRAANPTKKFYLNYFGIADPRAYGIDYANVGPGYLYDPDRPAVHSPGDLGAGAYAVSATYLQGVQVPTEQREAMEALRKTQPLAVINGSIYVFNVESR